MIIDDVIVYVKEQLAGEGSGHDWWHAYRVWKLSETIQKQEGGDEEVIAIAALTHDVADPKLNNGSDEAGRKRLLHFLDTLPVNISVKEHVMSIVQTMSYKGAGVPTPMDTMEGKIVQDADRLDAIGAIGIARTFAFGGHHNRLLYDPEKAPSEHVSYQAYKNEKGHTINHFYEKLLLLKDRMNTTTALQMAKQRHEYMEQFLEQFFCEWEGKR